MTARPIAQFIALVLLAAGLAGCFKSEAQLIGAADADFPFQSITYVHVGEDDRITLKRSGNKYINPDEDDEVSLRIKALGGDLFVVQVSEVKDDGPLHLYGFIRLAPDKASFELIKGVADAQDLAAAANGATGLSLCPGDATSVCMAELKGFIDYANEAAGAGRGERFNILALE